MTKGLVYNYIIVGAGSAGCTLAARLTENPNCRVLLLEAGGWDRDPLIHIPLTWAKMLLEQSHDWGYFCKPEPTVNNREIECARGKVIGGSSSVNAMAYVRGNRGDYNRWADSGLSSWSYKHVLPYFKKLETWESSDPFRGSSGPINVQHCRYEDPLVEAYGEAGIAGGFGWTDDYNGNIQEGFSRLQMTIKNGRRCSAANAYLRPSLQRKNLVVKVNSLTTKVAFENNRAIGVHFTQNNQSFFAHADQEVILCAGVINTPQLLMLSGIGDSKKLRKIGIESKLHLEGVGMNLQDQMSAIILYKRKENGPFHHNMRVDRIVSSLAKTYFLGTGFASDVPGGMTAFLRTDSSYDLPNIQLLLTAAPLGAWPYLRPFKKPFNDGFVSRVVLLNPESRGEVEVVSSNIKVKPMIKQNFLSTPRDWTTLRDGLRIARDIATQPCMEQFIDKEILPGISKTSNEELSNHIAETAITLHHPLGTCRMGSQNDLTAVVDSKLRVIGAEGLRVVDGSVMPDLVRGNINGPIIMIAEKAADYIRNKESLPPEEN
ncbi:MAG: dehydrogenase [Acidiferrobacteraceae bacterium]|nr:dehydrogenase [Acidiferrobacteraceae bacterium]|tara:strand:+ start:6851 stop:8485 length:1635 start_codon:yes stop_codon:yes gene_type:complete